MALLAVVCLLALWPKQHPAQAPHAIVSEMLTEPAAPVALPHAASPSPAEEMRDPPPVIDEVLVEKKEVCSGEDNLVTVRAHTTNGTNAFLHYSIDGHLGASVPITLFLDDKQQVVGDHSISVFGRGNVATTIPIPAYRVRNCQTTHAVLVETRVQPNTVAEYEFVARVLSISSKEPYRKRYGSEGTFVPVSYVWRFGDGDTTRTVVPNVSHSYERRQQDSMFTSMLVSVEVRSAAGEKLTGRISLALLNTAFEARQQKGIVNLLLALTPRFPVLDDRGRVEQQVRLWHSDSRPVTIDSAVMTKYFEFASGESSPQPVSVGSLLGATTIPPGPDGLTTTVSLDTVAEPRVFSVTYRLSGKAADGTPVMGSFSVMRPPPRPTRDNSQRVSDPVLTAKILMAREILQKDFVNDDDVHLLESQGKFAKLDQKKLRETPIPEGPRSLPPGPGVPPGATSMPAAAINSAPSESTSAENAQAASSPAKSDSLRQRQAN